MNGKGSVLIADDETIFSMMLSRGLRKLGFSVCASVSSGEEAVKAAREHAPDCILLDLHLNGSMTGIDAAGCIRGFSDALILFVTGYPEDYTEKAIEGISGSRELYKPVNSVQIGEELRDMLSIRES
jgi:two-component system, response regulator PdtaR